MIFLPAAYAHEVHPGASPAVFVLKWAFDPTLILFSMIGVLYAYGLWNFGRRAPISFARQISFGLGLAVFFASYLPPVDTYADQLFSVHMIQHMLIIMVGVPLVVVGAPFLIVTRALSQSPMRHPTLALLRNSHLRKFLAKAQNPMAAVVIFETTFWFWHLPKFYDLALLNDLIHLLEHGCMAIAAINIWYLLVDPPPAKGRLAIPQRMMIIGLMLILDTVLGAALTYSAKVWYAYDRLPLVKEWPLSRLEDQQLGGLIMWVPGSVVWILVLIFLFNSWWQQEDQIKSVHIRT